MVVRERCRAARTYLDMWMMLEQTQSVRDEASSRPFGQEYTISKAVERQASYSLHWCLCGQQTARKVLGTDGMEEDVRLLWVGCRLRAVRLLREARDVGAPRSEVEPLICRRRLGQHPSSKAEGDGSECGGGMHGCGLLVQVHVCKCQA